MENDFNADAIAKAVAPWPTHKAKAADLGQMAADRAQDSYLFLLSPAGRSVDDVYALARAAAHFGIRSRWSRRG